MVILYVQSVVVINSLVFGYLDIVLFNKLSILHCVQQVEGIRTGKEGSIMYV